MKDYLPYCYLIGWLKLNKWYYGCEHSKDPSYKIANPSNLWNTYFTSSTQVAWMREFYGEPDVIQIRKIFHTSLEATSWERRFLVKIDAMNHPNFLNRSNASHPALEKSQSHKDKIGLAHKGRKIPPEQIVKAVNTRLENHGVYCTEIQKAAIGLAMKEFHAKLSEKEKEVLYERFKGENNPRFGVTVTTDTRNKIGIANKGKTRTPEEKKARSERSKGSGNSMFGKIRITNGKENSSIPKNSEIPAGYWRGITRFQSTKSEASW